MKTTHEKRLEIYETKEQYLQMKEEWRKIKNHSNLQHIAYNILRGLPSDRGFTKPSNSIKIENGDKGKYANYKSWLFPNKGRAIKYISKFPLEQTFNNVINENTFRKAIQLAEDIDGEC